jgi:hypothetical protein
MCTKRLRERSIYRNNCIADTEYILASLRALGYELHQCLVLSDGILIDIERIEKYHDRPRTLLNEPNTHLRAKQILFVPLPFTFSELTDWGYFKGFQRLLWYTKVHFDSCFDMGIWTPDERGIYCRSEELVAGLTDLSRLHNIMSAAMECFRSGEEKSGWVKVRTAFDLSNTVVQTHHHRQFPDLLAIILLLQRQDRFDVQERMMKHLCDLANVVLEHNDPRKTMFNELLELPVDTAGHLYIAYDTCCRDIWKTKTGKSDLIKAYYGYNQASLPRTSPGKFYELYEGKTAVEIGSILREVDQKFVASDHARVCLWQTAIRFLLQEQKYPQAEYICKSLLLSIVQCEGPQEHCQWRQWNVDISISLFLLGSVSESQSKCTEAIQNFESCVNKRNEMVLEGVWDPIRAGALKRMEHLANRSGDTVMLNNCKMQLRKLDSALEEQDRMR